MGGGSPARAGVPGDRAESPAPQTPESQEERPDIATGRQASHRPPERNTRSEGSGGRRGAGD